MSIFAIADSGRRSLFRDFIAKYAIFISAINSLFVGISARCLSCQSYKLRTSSA